MKFCLYLALFGGVYSSKMATAALEELTEKLVSCCSKVLLNMQELPKTLRAIMFEPAVSQTGLDYQRG